MSKQRPKKRLTHEAFDKLVEKALASIPRRFRPYLDNTVVVAEDRPSRKVLKEMGLKARDALYGLYEGTPLTERSADKALPPDRIAIFRGALIEDFGGDPDEIVAQVRLTVLHEIGHHFGLDEDAMEDGE